VLIALAAACSGADEEPADASGTTAPPPDPERGGSIVYGTSGEVDGFNPLSSQWSGPAYVIGRAVMDPLVVMDRNGDWQPYLAKTITPNDDFTVWTFELRPGIEFHNGEALDAEALAMFFDAATTSPLSSQGFPEKPEIAVVDDLTVTLTFTQPWAAMPTVLVEQPGYVIAPEQLESGDTQHAIGTGPFIFEEWVPDSHVRVNRNPDYWRQGLPYLDSIEFRPYPDPTSRENALRTDEADVIEQGTIGQPDLDEYAADGMTIIDDVDNVGVANLLMNNDAPDTAEHDVRLAIVSAIDREAFRAAVLDESFEVADQPYPSDDRWHADVEYPAYDPDLARQLVEEHEAENGPLELTMMRIAGQSPTGPQYLQEALGQVGIDIEIEDLELSAYVRRFVAGEYETVYLGSFFGAPDPDGNYMFLTSKGAAPETLIKLNFARYRDETVDDALEAQRRTDDPDERHAEWTKVWAALAEDLPYAFLYFDRFAVIAQPDVYGLGTPTTPEGVELPAINRWTPFFTEVYVDQ
jgi:ABC-type transport system substrate-binding protein